MGKDHNLVNRIFPIAADNRDIGELAAAEVPRIR